MHAYTKPLLSIRACHLIITLQTNTGIECIDFYLSLDVYKRELLVNDSCALIPGMGIKLIRSESNLEH
jgi:hypothetical protein